MHMPGAMHMHMPGAMHMHVSCKTTVLCQGANDAVGEVELRAAFAKLPSTRPSTAISSYLPSTAISSEVEVVLLQLEVRARGPCYAHTLAAHAARARRTLHAQHLPSTPAVHTCRPHLPSTPAARRFLRRLTCVWPSRPAEGDATWRSRLAPPRR